MQPKIQQKLKDIIVEHGTSIVNDPRRIKSMLKDLFPQNKREVRVLSTVLDEGFAKRLLRDGDKIPTSISIPQYAQILHDDLGLDLTLAKWAVETWAMTLSLEMPKATPAPTLLPTQAPTPKPTSEPTDAWMQRLWNWADKHNISSIPRDRSRLVNLTALSLRYSNIDKLPPEIGELSNLMTLSLWGNQLTNLPPEIGKLTNLTTLNLLGNQLSVLPLEIRNLTKLIEISIGYNQLSDTEIDRIKRLLPTCRVIF